MFQFQFITTGVLISPQPDPTEKKQLKGRQFSSDAEVVAVAQTWLDGQPAEFYLSDLQKLEFGCCSLFPSWSGQGLISTWVHLLIYYWNFFFFLALQPSVDRVLSLSRIHDHTQSYHSRQDSSGRVINPSQRLIPDNTQHSQQTDIRAPAAFEISIPAGERLQTHAIDHVASGIGTALRYIMECDDITRYVKSGEAGAELHIRQSLVTVSILSVLQYRHGQCHPITDVKETLNLTFCVNFGARKGGCRILCFVDCASLYNIANKSNQVQDSV